MSIPNPIGAVHFEEPRAVMVREPEDLKSMHSAIHSGINVYVDSMIEGQAVIAAWPLIMQTAADKIAEVLTAVRATKKKPQPEAEPVPESEPSSG